MSKKDKINGGCFLGNFFDATLPAFSQRSRRRNSRLTSSPLRKACPREGGGLDKTRRGVGNGFIRSGCCEIAERINAFPTQERIVWIPAEYAGMTEHGINGYWQHLLEEKNHDELY